MLVKAQIDHGACVKDGRALLIGAGAAGSAIAIALLEALAEHVVLDTVQQRDFLHAYRHRTFSPTAP
ncbi:hypothetical protein BSLA_03f0589 [Burkholderia stabilis]|nr:hypothetical protein BSLA_03f0589 [Burkholderia stabilis]